MSATKMVPVEHVHENAWNPNAVPEHIQQALVANIARVGFVAPILVRPHPKREGEYEVVDGAHRLRAALERGEKRIPVVIRDLSDDEAKAQTLALNKLRGEMEPADVARLLQDIEIDLPELAEFTGYTASELRLLDDLHSVPLPAPDPPPQNDEWVTFSLRVPEPVATLARAELDRLKAVLETEHDHMALEAMVANSAETPAESLR